MDKKRKEFLVPSPNSHPFDRSGAGLRGPPGFLLIPWLFLSFFGLGISL